MRSLPARRRTGRDAIPASRSREAGDTSHEAQVVISMDGGEDVEVDGTPMHLELEKSREVSRRLIATTTIAGYTILCGAGLAAVTFANSDAQAVVIILGPYGAAVTTVLTYYFIRGRR